MRRIVRYVCEYAAELVQRVADSWSNFWFTPTDPTILGVIRLLTGLMLVYTHAVWGLGLQAFFGPDGWMGEAAMRSLQSGQFVFSYLWYVPPDWLAVAHGAAMVVLVLFTLGVFTRITSALSFLILINYAHRTPAALFGLDQINALLTLYLVMGPSGSGFSVDRLFARYRIARQTLSSDPAAELDLTPATSVAATISLRLIQVHICVIYFFAGMSKLLGEAWWDGTAIWRVAASYEYQSADLSWLAHAPLLVNLLTHLAAYWELSYCVLIWPRLTRPLVIAGAVLMHLGIGLFMGMMTFGLIMLVGNLSFASPNLVHELISALARGRRSLTVVYDGACNLCVRSMSFIKAVDTGNQIRLVDFNRVDPQTVHPLLTHEACVNAMQVIPDDATQAGLFSGYWGFKVIAKQLRLLWPVVPLFSIPGAGFLGPLLYRVIARNRARRLGCFTGACAVHAAENAGTPNQARGPLSCTIKLPEDAKLFIQDEFVPGEGRKRNFKSTPGRYGKDYVFNVRVEVVRDGVEVSMSQEVRLRAGQHSVVRFALGESDHTKNGEGGNGEKRPELIEAQDANKLCSLQTMAKCEVPS